MSEMTEAGLITTDILVINSAGGKSQKSKWSLIDNLIVFPQP